MLNRKLHTQLRRYRLAADLSQEELAVCVGVTRKTINVIEGGDYAPSVALVLAIAEVLGVSVHDLFHLDGRLK